MLRVLDWQEQSCLTLEAQALIYQYRSGQWLTPQQLEQVITEAMVISQLRQSPADADLVKRVVMSIGDDRSGPVIFAEDDQEPLLS